MLVFNSPLLAVACSKGDPLGSARKSEGDQGKALAGKSTLNRLELAVEDGASKRYKTIKADLEKVENLLLNPAVKALPRKQRMIVLDFDATDDRIHGNQEGKFYHGYYKSHGYLPLYCFVGNLPLWAQLRTSDRDASDGTVEALEKIIPAIRARFGKKVKIWVRGDSGFARDSIMSWCEKQRNVFYLLGMARNARLQKELEEDFVRIESANQLRLWFSAFAHLLVELLREGVLKKTSLTSATIGTIRLRFFKVAARVKVSTRRVLVEWSSACPNRRDYQLSHSALCG